MFEKIIKSAKIYNEVSVTHNKFEKFRYYEIPVRYNDSIVFVTVNVGKGINDGKYHIYDLTEPKERDTVHRVNDVGQPVGNALVNGISKHSIPDTTKTVNKKLSATDSAYLEAVERGDMETPPRPKNPQNKNPPPRMVAKSK